MIKAIVEIGEKNTCNCLSCLLFSRVERYSILSKNKKENIFAAKLHYDILKIKNPKDLIQN